MEIFRRYTILLTILLCLACNALAQQNGPHPIASHQPPADSWTIESWAGDNRPYKEAREQINKAVADKQDLKALIKQYEVLAQQKSSDPKPEYRYAYAAYRAAIEAKPFDANSLISIRDALQRGFPPHAYDYTRLRFLVESTLFANQSLIPVGKRLLSHDPKDVSVKYNLIKVLTCSVTASDKEEAVKYAQDLLLAKPENANYHATLAGAYLSIWFRSKDNSLANKAIAEYQQYLQLAPANADYRQTVNRLLMTLQRMTGK